MTREWVLLTHYLTQTAFCNAMLCSFFSLYLNSIGCVVLIYNTITPFIMTRQIRLFSPKISDKAVYANFCKFQKISNRFEKVLNKSWIVLRDLQSNLKRSSYVSKFNIALYFHRTQINLGFCQLFWKCFFHLLINFEPCISTHVSYHPTLCLLTYWVLFMIKHFYDLSWFQNCWKISMPKVVEMAENFYLEEKKKKKIATTGDAF